MIEYYKFPRKRKLVIEFESRYDYDENKRKWKLVIFGHSFGYNWGLYF